MGFCAKVLKCECCAPTRKEEEQTELTRDINAETVGIAGTESPKTPPKVSQKAVLKQLVKQFLKDAQAGIEVAYFDYSSDAVIPGAFRLADRLQTITIAPLSNEIAVANYFFDDVRDIVKITSREPEETDEGPQSPSEEVSRFKSDLAVDIPYGVQFIFVQDDVRPLILSLPTKEQQAKFYAATNVVQHLARRRGAN